MAFLKKKVGLQGTWPKALTLLLSPLLIVLTLRWVFFEPFVIPSGSMKPNLLVHDHIIVKKYSYGIRWPFSHGWILRYAEPDRGDVIVFRYPLNSKVFYIKRVIGLPGDVVQISNGQITVNEKPWILRPIPIENSNFASEDSSQFNYFFESIPREQSRFHKIDQKTMAEQARKNEDAQRESEAIDTNERIKKMQDEDFKLQFLASQTPETIIRLYAQRSQLNNEVKKWVVPKNSYFVMGDNRDESQDSRIWGFVPEDLLIGKAHLIWLSCYEMLETAPMLCDPKELRTDRIFKRIE